MAYSWHRFESAGWSGQNWMARARRGSRIDPYLVWADATGFSDLGGIPQKWIPVVIELSGTTAKQFAKAMESKPWIRVSPFFLNPAKGLEYTTFCTATVTAEFFSQVDKIPLRNQVNRYEIALPIRSTIDPYSPTDADANGKIAPEAREQPNREASAPPTIMGIIDDGLAFAHSRFREYGGKSTRIEYFCNQGYTSVDSPNPDYGRELTKKQLDNYMRDSTHAGLINEDTVYRLADYREANGQVAHGTHILDLLCGEDCAKVTNESPRIICVQIQLPSRRTRDTSGRSLALHALNGLRYILDRADSISRKYSSELCPVIVNLSYGYIAGPHDGSSMLEQAVDELIDRRGKLVVVVPAGNSHLARCHARFTLAGDAEQVLTWRILPDDATPNFMEIWLPLDAKSPDVAVEIIPPWGTGSGLIEKNQVYTWQNGNDVICSVVYLDKVTTGDGTMILIAISPTSTLDSDRKTAPSGAWSIRVRNNGKNKVSIDAWIQRDEIPFAYRIRGRQSRFEDADYAVYNFAGRVVEVDNGSYVKRAGTVNAIATGRNTVVVGGFDRTDGKTARYSAKGASSQRSYWNGPDALTVTDDSIVNTGILAAGTRSGAVFAMNGTSVAAPQIARTLVLQAASKQPVPIPQLLPNPVARKTKKPGRMRIPPSTQPDRQSVAEGAEHWESTNANRFATKPDVLHRRGAGRIELPVKTLKVKR